MDKIVYEVSDANLWRGFAEALGAELRPDKVIRGASGLEHNVQAIAVDDTSKRVVIVSAEANPRIAAMMQVDVQATLSDVRVLVARPVAIDISTIARRLLEPLGVGVIDVAQAKAFFATHAKSGNRRSRRSRQPQELNPATQNILEGAFKVFEYVKLPPVDQIASIVMQAQFLPWNQIMSLLGQSAQSGTLDLRSLIGTDSLQYDLNAGVCPVPLYEFSEADFETFRRPGHRDEVRERLKALGIFQYFFPPADQLALGLVDQGIASEPMVLEAAEQAPAIGHPFGLPELVDRPANLLDMLDQMKGLGYVAEGEHGVEISEKGRLVRTSVKFRPREGLLTKLLNRFSLNATISPKDFLGP